MQCFSSCVDKCDVDRLRESSRQKHNLTGLEDLCVFISETESRSDLKGAFDESLSKLRNKIVALNLDSSKFQPSVR